MAKAKKSQTKLIVLAVSALLAVLAVVFFFALAAVNVVNSNNEVQSSYTGMQVAFGCSTSTKVLGSTVTTKILDFSFLYFLAFLLAVLGLVATCASVVLKKQAKLVKFIAAGLLVAAGVVFFLAVPATMANVDGVKQAYSWFGSTADVNQLRANFRESCRLGVGAILSGILAVLAGLGVCASEFVK